jgi:hypothetical protein
MSDQLTPELLKLEKPVHRRTENSQTSKTRTAKSPPPRIKARKPESREANRETERDQPVLASVEAGRIAMSRLPWVRQPRRGFHCRP